MIKNFIDMRKVIDRYMGIPILMCLKFFNLSANQQKAQEVSNESVNKVLVIYLSGLGDTVMVLSCLKYLGEHYPSAELSVLTSSLNYGIVKANRYALQIFHLNIKRGICCFIGSFFNIMRELQRARYDVIIDFEQFLRLSAIISFLSKGKQRVGFGAKNQCRHWAYRKTLIYDPSLHTFDNFLGLLSLLGINNKPKKLEKLYVSEEDKAVVRSLIRENGITNTHFLIGIHPGSGTTGMSRRWEPAKFSAIADLLIVKYNAKIIFTGVGDEKQLIHSIISGAKNEKNCYNFAGKVTISQLPFLLTLCRAFLSNDTGPLHIAAAMKVPGVALFGPNTPRRYGPIGKMGIGSFIKKQNVAPVY